MAALPEMIKNLPEEVINSLILPRLPVKLVGLGRCASKLWRSLLSTPQFAKAHLKAHEDGPECLINNSNGLRILTITATGESVNAFYGHEVNIPFLDTRGWCGISGICDGLVLLNVAHEVNDMKIVMNPITREAVKLPECPDRFFARTLGLGYDSLADDYKVVSFTSSGNYYVYSLKTKCWRGIGRFHHRDFDSYKSAVYLRDHFYWLNIDLQSVVIVSFDLAREKFEQIPLPSGVCDDFHAVDINVLGGSLTLMHERNPNAIDVWVMEDYDVKASWTKLTTMRFPPEGHGRRGPVWEELRKPVVSFLKCMYFWNENEIVVQIRYYGLHNHDLWAYNWRNAGWREIHVVEEDTTSFGVAPAKTFKESLVSPNYI